LNKDSGVPISKDYPLKVDALSDPNCIPLFNEYIENLFSDEPNNVVCSVSGKREVRKIDKDPRIYMVSPLHSVWQGIRFFHTQNEYFRTHKTPVSVGFSPMYGGWDKFMKSFPHTTYCDSDFSQYDSSICAELLWFVCDMRISWLPIGKKFLAKGIRSWYAQMINSLVLLEDGSVWQKGGGMPSGMSNTIYDNCLINHIIWVYAHLESGGQLSNYEDLFYHKFMGDDNLSSFDEERIEAVRDYPRIWQTHFGIKTKYLSISGNIMQHTWLSSTTVIMYGKMVPVPDGAKLLDNLYHCCRSLTKADELLKVEALKRLSWSLPAIYNLIESIMDNYILTHREELERHVTPTSNWSVLQSSIFTYDQVSYLWLGDMPHVESRVMSREEKDLAFDRIDGYLAQRDRGSMIRRAHP